jgi:hypothetical protein
MVYDLDIANLIFFTFFFIEMIIKVTGLGPRQYVRDQYNIFDALVVTLSVVDVTLSYSLVDNEVSTGKGAISAFRAFRLIRVFKLVKTWTKLQQLL